MSETPRAILYHKQSTSARTRFVKLPYGGILAFDALPALAQVQSVDEVNVDDAVRNTLLEKIQNEFHMEPSDLEVDLDFQVLVDVPKTSVPILLIRFATMDPPLEKIADSGSKFIHLTEARGLTTVEMQLLEIAYRAIMEG